MSLHCSLGQVELANYLARQISGFFPDHDVQGSDYAPFVDDALARLGRCLEGLKDKYLEEGKKTRFSHLHTDHYATFLYFVSNSIHRMNGPRELAEKCYGLNKALNGLDVYFEVSLPEVFKLQHPVATVLGRAQYSNYLVVYQRCSVGGSRGIYPRLKEGIVLYAGAAVLGSSHIGSNVWMAAGTQIVDEDVPDGSLVFGNSRQLTVRPATRDVISEHFQTKGKRGGITETP